MRHFCGPVATEIVRSIRGCEQNVFITDVDILANTSSSTRVRPIFVRILSMYVSATLAGTQGIESYTKSDGISGDAANSVMPTRGVC